MSNAETASPSQARILKVAALLNADPGSLILAASAERGGFELDIFRDAPEGAAIVGTLVAGLAGGSVTDRQMERIRDVLAE